MKKLALTLSVLALTASAAMSQQVVRIATEGAYPPFNFINEAKELVGYEIELGNEMCKRAEVTCEWIVNDWDSIIPNLVGGNYDAIMAGMNATEARAQVIMFSNAYKKPDPSAYVALKDTAADVVDSGVIAAQSNTVQSGMVADTGATLLEFPTPDETIAAVRNGTADAVLADKDFLLTYVNDSNGELVILKDQPTPGQGVSIGLRQSDAELKAKLDGVIDGMKADGSLNALLVKWFGAEVPTF